MEHEDIYALMMEALDGEIGDEGRGRLNDHLRGCLACSVEWQALHAVHHFLLQVPALSPAAGFAQRTLAHLPGTRERILLLSAAYGLLLLSGLAPLVIVLWLAINLGPALEQPAFLQSIWQGAGEVLDLAGAVLGAAWGGLAQLGSAIGQRPVLVGWLLILTGIVFLWGGVYVRLTGQRMVESR
jgi:hypothetical protein